MRRIDIARMMTFGVGVVLLLVIPHMAHGQRGAIHAVARISHVANTSALHENTGYTDSTSRDARLDAFFERLAADVPHLLAVVLDTTHADSRAPESQAHDVHARRLSRFGDPRVTNPRLGWEHWARHQARMTWPSAVWLDSVRAAWPALEPDLRVMMVLTGSAFLPAFIDYLSTHPTQRGVDHLETAYRAAIGSPAVWAAHGSTDALAAVHTAELIASSRLVTGMLALARGDTTGAMTALWDAATVEIVTTADGAASSVPAATVFTALAEARRDTVQWILGLTLQRLRHPPTYWDTQDFLTDALLQDVYRAFTATGRSVPDLAPTLLRSDPPPMTPPSFQAYLDRQWTALFDRLPMYAVADRPEPAAAETARRLVIMEYGSSLSCCGCWTEDRAMSALERHYGADHLLPLSYRMPGEDGPIMTLADPSANQRYVEWYPWDGASGNDTVHHGIPRQVYRGARGELLDGVRIDGEPRIPKRPGLPHSFKDAYANAIDRELQRPPEAHLRVRAEQQWSTLTVTTFVDSLSLPRSRVALRLMLVRDTVRLNSGTVRRLMFNTVFAVSHSDGLSLGLPLPVNAADAVHYTFDLAALERGIAGQRTTETWRTFLAQNDFWRTQDLDVAARAIEERNGAFVKFPDPRDWQVDWSHVFLVALAQDLDTGDILQALRMPLQLSETAIHAAAPSLSQASN